MDNHARLIPRLRGWVTLFILGLVLSGATAIPIRWQTELLSKWTNVIQPPSQYIEGTWQHWIARISNAVFTLDSQFPFLGYAGDWLAFGHFGIALIFVWAWREPVRYRFLYDAGLVLCLLVIPYALICGHFRGIPLGWRVIDCVFGVVGALPLWRCQVLARRADDSFRDAR